MKGYLDAKELESYKKKEGAGYGSRYHNINRENAGGAAYQQHQ